jgi:hypothetical protein
LSRRLDGAGGLAQAADQGGVTELVLVVFGDALPC